MGAPVVHFEIIGGEGDELEKFYGELFGWKINSNNPMKYGTVDTSGGPEALTAEWARPTTVNGAFPYTPKSKICKLRWIAPKSLGAKQSCRQAGCSWLTWPAEGR